MEEGKPGAYDAWGHLSGKLVACRGAVRSGKGRAAPRGTEWAGGREADPPE